MRVQSSFLRALAALGAALCLPAAEVLAGDFVNFESSQVHPLAYSATARQLYAANTPEGRLAIFDVGPDGGLVFAGDVPVGLDPVSIAVRPGTSEVWVANHVSDSVSIVDIAQRKLVATLQVGDEPTDVVFASGRAFVSRAGKEDVVEVYDAATRAEIATIAIFGDDPRAMAVSADGREVYLVVLESGNRTITLGPTQVARGPGLPPDHPARDPALPPVNNALIVQYDLQTGRWVDEAGQDWTGVVDMERPDLDLFVIDADAVVPGVVRTVPAVGTILYDVVANPMSGELYVPNTDARNLVRFMPNLSGHLVATRVSRVDPASGAVDHVDLNPHIDYGVTPGPAWEVDLSLSQPGNGVFTADGTRFYLSAFGSDRVAVLDAATGAVLDRIPVGGGPAGLALDEADDRLYVLNRFTNTISIVDTAARREIGLVGVAGPSRFDPSPTAVTAGRRILYDARFSSGHGDTACATCHVFGNFDGLAWDLGDPTGEFVPYQQAPWVVFDPDPPLRTGFHPMKGPMATQTMRGLAGQAPLHWRGDRRNLHDFNVNFVAALGRGSEISPGAMDAFVDFIETITFPPNPFRTLADGLPASIPVLDVAGGGALTAADPAAGENLFSHVATSRSFIEGIPLTCADCHAFPAGTTNKLTGAPLDSHDSKVAHMRNIYEKASFTPIRVAALDFRNVGVRAQKGSVGVLHHGGVSLTEFLAKFIPDDVSGQHDLAAFMLAFPSGTAPAIGRQVTVDPDHRNDAAAIDTIAILLDQARAGNCDVVAKGTLVGTSRGWVYDPQADVFVPDAAAEPAVSEAVLRATLGPADIVTFMGTPPGTGIRSGIDRDRDGWLDGDEGAQKTDGADPGSVPILCASGAVGGIARPRLGIRRMFSPTSAARLALDGRFVLPVPLEPPVDPTGGGINFKVVDSSGATIFHVAIPPGRASSAGAAGWAAPADGRWVFRDRTDSLGRGITKLTVRRGSKEEPGLFTFRIRGRSGSWRVDAADLPLGVSILMGASAQDVANQCASVRFDTTACRLSAGGDSVACR